MASTVPIVGRNSVRGQKDAGMRFHHAAAQHCNLGAARSARREKTKHRKKCGLFLGAHSGVTVGRFVANFGDPVSPFVEVVGVVGIDELAVLVVLMRREVGDCVGVGQ